MANNKIDILSIAVGNRIRIKSKKYGVLDGIVSHVEYGWLRLDTELTSRPLDFSDIEWVELVSNDTPDMVNHPQHYKSETGLEAIDVIEAFTSDLNGADAVHTAQVLKYILRWPHKNGLEDLEKAQWYLTRLINRVKTHKE